MTNLNEQMVALGTQRSVIRELFEFGKIRAAAIQACRHLQKSTKPPHAF